ncbi:response regulator transcription factor [Paramaledivibacter caminithermalis]|jgi:DNA-binding response OmpR family regulator|uniref:Stage 0 sporulation protein A homolog n=1 Tax=Paramaledivibacter caminithermalis (strain DSM 15212 / CIP 107654 / DViRD3) TaxID=1121301 RepID=A0A1M6TEV6_PARC5|nr:response regulator transcription factor [Paramaledivibacter caminithermalis]SHK55500.1 DNA-binding response regulator, OmpR family, contains REC and winged-helix (wHTH) domain [Paramaledivibacter caminithermalis DSM 15212]
MKNILIVDDEIKIVEFLEAFLKIENYGIFKAYDGIEALEIFEKEEIHLVILDLMLPKMSGEKVCKKIRSKSDVPIIMLSAKVDEENKVEGLDIGADDYVTKPFSAKELVSRIAAIIRRTYKEENLQAEKFVFNDGDLEVNLKQISVIKKGIKIKITPSEFKILKVLISNRGRILSRDKLVEKVFGIDFDGIDRTIDVHIMNIRRKIEDDPKNPKYIQTVYGMGYKFNC